MRLIAISSACACMVLVIFGFLILVVKDKITAEIIGTPGRAAAGSGGLIGMIIVFYKVIVAVLPRAPGVQ